MHRSLRVTAMLPLLGALTGCGLSVPEKTFPPRAEIPPSQSPYQTEEGNYENNIVIHLVCEVANGLYAAEESFHLPWLRSSKWGTAITLTITAQNQSGLSPGLSFFKPFENYVFKFPLNGNVTAARSFTMGAGGSVSANAQRTETIQFTLLNSAMINQVKNHHPNCESFETGAMIDGDLKIREFIYDKAQISKIGNINLYAGKNVSIAGNYPGYNTFTETITFIATLSGNLNPSWKLSDFSNNTSGASLLSATATYTNTAIITIGTIGTAPSETEAASLGNAGASQHQAQVQGAANATAISGALGF